MDSNSLNTIIGIIAGIVSILTGVVALAQVAKTKKAAETPPTEASPDNRQKTAVSKKPAPKPSPVSSSPAVPPTVPGVTEFVGDDAGYQTWLESNPKGLVINTGRKPNPEYMALHRASCSHVSNFASREAGAFTERDYIKGCSTDVNQLREWTKARGRTDGTFTGNCHCKPL